jgi:hypothetical protein
VCVCVCVWLQQSSKTIKAPLLHQWLMQGSQEFLLLLTMIMSLWDDSFCCVIGLSRKVGNVWQGGRYTVGLLIGISSILSNKMSPPSYSTSRGGLKVYLCHQPIPYYWWCTSPCQNQIRSNQMLLVTCADYNRCWPYSEMLTYEPLTNSAVSKKYG